MSWYTGTPSHFALMSHSARSIAASTFIRSGTPGRPPYQIRSFMSSMRRGSSPISRRPITVSAVASDAEVCQS